MKTLAEKGMSLDIAVSGKFLEGSEALHSFVSIFPLKTETLRGKKKKNPKMCQAAPTQMLLELQCESYTPGFHFNSI